MQTWKLDYNILLIYILVWFFTRKLYFWVIDPFGLVFFIHFRGGAFLGVQDMT